MRNRLVLGAASAALMLAVAVPAMAHQRPQQQSQQPTLVADVAIVNNGATSVADSGQISQINGVVVDDRSEVEDSNVGGGNTSYTGNARSSALAVTVANTRAGCSTCGTPAKSDTNFALINNGAGSEAYTGLVGQQNGVSVDDGSEVEDSNVGGGNTSYTGNARSGSAAFTVVNSRISR